MQLLDPASIAIDRELQAILGELEEVYRELNEARDRAKSGPGQEPAESFDLIVDAVHDSAALEGLARTRRETLSQVEALLKAEKERRPLTLTEVQALYKAYLRVGEWVSQGHPPGPDTARALHGILLPGGTYNPPGEWRRENNVITRGTWMTPVFSEVPTLMDRFGQLLAAHIEDQNPVVLGAWAHHTFVQIHPFMDANGRIGRLMGDHLLYDRRCSPAILSVSQQDQYYSALEGADQGDLQPLIRMVAAACRETAQRQISEYARRSRRSMEWAEAFAQKSQEHLRQKEERVYRTWRRVFEDVREAFELAAEALGRVGEIQVQFRRYPILEFDAWRSLCRGGRTGGNWFFTLSFLRGTKFLLFVFSFGRHFVEPQDPEEDRGEFTPALVIARQLPPGPRVRLGYGSFGTAFPRLRELYHNDRRLCARLTYASEERWDRIVVEPSDVDRVVREFFEDVLREDFDLRPTG